MTSRAVMGATVGLAGGLVVVSGAARLVDASSAPKFSMRGTQFDQATFGGRFKQMLSNMDPSTLLYSDADVRAAEQKIKDFEAGGSKLSDAELWQARKIVSAAVHPDTKEIIPGPFRMAGYVPYNGPVCVWMMIASSTPSLLAANFVNQSQNALVNYFNRNASSPSSNEVLAKSYATAVTTALTVAFGISQVIKRSFSPATAKKMLTFVALPSSMIASSANAWIMRSPERETGIAVFDKQGVDVAPGHRSKAAATKAVTETALSRVLLQFPTFFGTPAIMLLPPVAAAAASSAVVGYGINTFLTIVAFGLGLPAAVAYFPVEGEIAVKDLDEGPAKAAAQKRGLEVVYYNKGL